MELDILFRFGLLGALLMGSAFFAGCDIALFSLGEAKASRLKTEGGRMGARAAALLEDPHRLLVVIYIGNELINVAISSIITILALDLFADLGIALFLGAGAMALLVFGEIIPKAMAHAYNEKWALWAAYPLTIFMWLVWPVQIVVNFISQVVVWLVPAPDGADGARLGLSEAEFKTLMEEGAEEGIIAESEKEMVQNVIEMADTTVEEIMTPRTDIVGLEVGTPLKEAWDMMNETYFARAPVYEKELDYVVGTLYKKDFLKLAYPPPENMTLRDLIREPFIVPETMSAKELLREFQKSKYHMAVVMDEYGGAQGVVTLDDALESLVGEVKTGREPEKITKISGGAYRVSAICPLEEFQEFFGQGPEHEELETIGGYVFHLFGKPPKWGESVESHGFRFTVDKVRGHRIMELRVKRLDGPEQPGNGD